MNKKIIYWFVFVGVLVLLLNSMAGAWTSSGNVYADYGIGYTMQRSTDVGLTACGYGSLDSDDGTYCGNGLGIDAGEFGYVNSTHPYAVPLDAAVGTVWACSSFSVSSKHGDKAADTTSLLVGENSTGAWGYSVLETCSGSGCVAWRTEYLHCHNVSSFIDSSIKARSIRIALDMYESDDRSQYPRVDQNYVDITYSTDETCMCFDKTNEVYLNCAEASVNDFCDSNVTQPDIGFLKDSYLSASGPVACNFTEETSCSDGYDNDCDGMVDCADSNCLLYGCSLSAWGYSCGNFTAGIDYGAYEYDCTDLSDNDGDGHVDCFDDDCVYSEKCPAITSDNCTCPDLNGNGEIYHDWGDLELAVGTGDYDKVNKCVQIYKPYCVDGETRDFLDWMRDDGYYGRISSIYAQAANDLSRRSEGNNANMGWYYAIRNGSLSFPSVTKFKEDSSYAVHFTEINATDSNFITQLNTDGEVQSYLKPYMEQMYSRSISMPYEVAQVNYVESFGNYSNTSSPCSVTSANDVCFDLNAERAWATGYFNMSNENLAHWGALNLTTGEIVYMHTLNNINGYAAVNNWMVTNPVRLVTYAHEWGHQLSLPHPLAVYPYLGSGKDVLNLIGTCGVMASGGYVYGCVNMLDPLERYALEPVGGYNNLDYAETYSQEALTC